MTVSSYFLRLTVKESRSPPPERESPWWSQRLACRPGPGSPLCSHSRDCSAVKMTFGVKENVQLVSVCLLLSRLLLFRKCSVAKTKTMLK